MSEKYKINFIILYFGTFPNYFQLFLNSCKQNPDIDWTIITDNIDIYSIPGNVHIVKDTFQNIRDKINSRFDFDVNIANVHKLCEFKPAYAYLFPEIVEGYDFWGYCDVDLIFGKIQNFITDDILDKYNKIFCLGHMTLIRNEKKYNEMFMQPVEETFLYKKAFSTEDNYNFDEIFLDKPNINTIFENCGETVFRKDDCIADIYTKSSVFRIVTPNGVEGKKRGFFIWNEGVLKYYYKINNIVKEKEYIYIHLQKRRMKVNVDISNLLVYKIIPNTFEPLEISVKEIEEEFNSVRKRHYNMHYLRIRYNNLKVKMKHIIGK